MRTSHTISFNQELAARLLHLGNPELPDFIDASILLHREIYFNPDRYKASGTKISLPPTATPHDTASRFAARAMRDYLQFIPGPLFDTPPLTAAGKPEIEASRLCFLMGMVILVGIKTREIEFGIQVLEFGYKCLSQPLKDLHVDLVIPPLLKEKDAALKQLIAFTDALDSKRLMPQHKISCWDYEFFSKLFSGLNGCDFSPDNVFRITRTVESSDDTRQYIHLPGGEGQTYYGSHHRMLMQVFEVNHEFAFNGGERVDVFFPPSGLSAQAWRQLVMEAQEASMLVDGVSGINPFTDCAQTLGKKRICFMRPHVGNSKNYPNMEVYCAFVQPDAPREIAKRWLMLARIAEYLRLAESRGVLWRGFSLASIGLDQPKSSKNIPQEAALLRPILLAEPFLSLANTGVSRFWNTASQHDFDEYRPAITTEPNTFNPALRMENIQQGVIYAFATAIHVALLDDHPLIEHDSSTFNGASLDEYYGMIRDKRYQEANQLFYQWITENKVRQKPAQTSAALVKEMKFLIRQLTEKSMATYSLQIAQEWQALKDARFWLHLATLLAACFNEEIKSAEDLLKHPSFTALTSIAMDIYSPTPSILQPLSRAHQPHLLISGQLAQDYHNEETVPGTQFPSSSSGARAIDLDSSDNPDVTVPYKTLLDLIKRADTPTANQVYQALANQSTPPLEPFPPHRKPGPIRAMPPPVPDHLQGNGNKK